jgi:uncharacterized protein
VWNAAVMTENHVSRPLALITGASAGIGAAFAQRLAADGHDLVLVARNRERLEQVAARAARVGAHSQIIVADLATMAGVTAMLNEIDAGSDEPLAFVVLNAGVTHAAAVGTTDPDQADQIVTLLATGVMHTAERLIPKMVAAGAGQMVIVSSIAAFTPMRKSAIYAASKSFITSYARSLDLEVRPSGVRVLAVCPGYVRTELHERAGLSHLRRSVPSFMWLEADQVVNESMKAVRNGKAVLVPGLIYRITRPFLNLRILQRVWGRLTKRPSRSR